MNKFCNNGDFEYRLVVTKPPELKLIGYFHFEIQSRFNGAKNPEDWRKCFDVTLSRCELQKLADIIGLHLAEFVQVSEIEGAPV